MAEAEQPETCCVYRRKIVVSARVLSEEECGVSDLDLADILEWNQDEPNTKPQLAFKYCPWCGTPRKPGDETRVTPPTPAVLLAVPVIGHAPPTPCANEGCSTWAYPSLPFCMACIREKDTENAIPFEAGVPCMDCREKVTHPNGCEGGFGLCDECLEKRESGDPEENPNGPFPY